jgi:hypothetical protein
VIGTHGTRSDFPEILESWMSRVRSRVHHDVSDGADGTGDGVLIRGLAALLFVAVAVVLELMASLWANSTVPAWAELAPIAWPPVARVAWWTAVALAALTYRRSLARAGLPQHRTVTVLTVAPFLVFAVGIAVGADWATWH